MRLVVEPVEPKVPWSRINGHFLLFLFHLIILYFRFISFYIIFISFHFAFMSFHIPMYIAMYMYMYTYMYMYMPTDSLPSHKSTSGSLGWGGVG